MLLLKELSDFLHFVEGENDLDSYFRQFERYASGANRPQANWPPS